MRHQALKFREWESLLESINIPTMRLPKPVELDENELDIIKNLKWQDLSWNDIGGDGNKTIWLKMSTPLDMDFTEGVTVDIQIIKGAFDQIHINLANDLQGIGLGTKIYRSIIEWTGHLYSGKGRRHNPIINKVWDKLKRDHTVECESNDIADICVSKNNPNKDFFLSLFRSM